MPPSRAGGASATRAGPICAAACAGPVISVGNLAVGGRGKTPRSPALARVLRDAGERPAILSRGYARTQPEDGVVVVSDAGRHPRRSRARRRRAADARAAAAWRRRCWSSSDRYLAGRLAEHHFGVTVHVLDDGFQHLQLDRDVDLVIVAPRGSRPERADAAVRPAARTARRAGRCGRGAGGRTGACDACRTTRRGRCSRLQRSAGRSLAGRRRRDATPGGVPVLARGRASPTRARFSSDLRAAGLDVAGTLVVPRSPSVFARTTSTRICGRARRRGAGAVVTTEKDFVRLLPFRPFPLPVAYLPLTMEPRAGGRVPALARRLAAGCPRHHR